MAFVNPLNTFPDPNIAPLLLSESKGRSWETLPTPAFAVSLPTVNANCVRMLDRVSATGAKFRAHVKTHKTIEGMRRQLGYDLPLYSGAQYRSIVVSTLKEAWSVVKYQQDQNEMLVNDIIYGLPNVTPESLLQISDLCKRVATFTMMIDSREHVKIIQEYSRGKNIRKPFTVIIKLDVGTHRAGVWDMEYLTAVLTDVVSSNAIELRGFYVHSGHSYDSTTIEESEEALIEELETVKRGLDQLEKAFPDLDLSELIVSVGATPTVHSLEHHVFQKSNARIIELQKEMKAQLEFHAGNFIFCDLQQVSTGCIDIANVAPAVVGTVISQYPGRNDEVGEILTNTGVICMSKETAHKFPGYGSIMTKDDYGDWHLQRMSQEHGILRPTGTNAKMIPIGTKCLVYPNHSCITANAFNAYYMLDADGKVCDVWIPWRGW